MVLNTTGNDLKHLITASTIRNPAELTYVRSARAVVSRLSCRANNCSRSAANCGASLDTTITSYVTPRPRVSESEPRQSSNKSIRFQKKQDDRRTRTLDGGEYRSRHQFGWCAGSRVNPFARCLNRQSDRGSVSCTSRSDNRFSSSRPWSDVTSCLALRRPRPTPEYITSGSRNGRGRITVATDTSALADRDRSGLGQLHRRQASMTEDASGQRSFKKGPNAFSRATRGRHLRWKQQMH